MDPLSEKFSWWTTYQYTGNMPVNFVDLDGMEPAYLDSRYGGTPMMPSDYNRQRTPSGAVLYRKVDKERVQDYGEV